MVFKPPEFQGDLGLKIDSLAWCSHWHFFPSADICWVIPLVISGPGRQCLCGVWEVVRDACSGLPHLNTPSLLLPVQTSAWQHGLVSLGTLDYSSPETHTSWLNSSLMSPEGEYLYFLGCYLVCLLFALQLPVSWSRVLGLQVFLIWLCPLISALFHLQPFTIPESLEVDQQHSQENCWIWIKKHSLRSSSAWLLILLLLLLL